MPKPVQRLHLMNSREASRSQQLLRQSRETYVPSRLRRMLREEGRLMLDFDAAPTMEARLKALDGLLRIRTWIRDSIGWPKPPTLRPGRLPAALDSVRSHNPLGDLDAEVLPVVAHPATPASEGERG